MTLEGNLSGNTLYYSILSLNKNGKKTVNKQQTKASEQHQSSSSYFCVKQSIPWGNVWADHGSTSTQRNKFTPSIASPVDLVITFHCNALIGYRSLWGSSYANKTVPALLLLSCVASYFVWRKTEKQRLEKLFKKEPWGVFEDAKGREECVMVCVLCHCTWGEAGFSFCCSFISVTS